MKPSVRRVLVQFAIWCCVIAGVLAVRLYLHHTGTSYKMTEVSFSFGRQAQAQASPKPETGMEAAKPAGAPSTSLRVTVAGKTTTFSVAELKAMPQKTVKVHNEHNNMDETYSGVELADVLAKCGFVVGKTTHQQIIHGYVKAEGTDKYWTIYSAIEVEPTEHNGDVIVATSLEGKPIGADGELKLVSTEDKKPQRWVKNLDAISLKTAE